MARKKRSEERTATGPLLERLAIAIAEAALDTKAEKPVSFDQKVDAFKALANYYQMQNKLGPEKTTGGFNGHTDAIEDFGRSAGGNAIAVERSADPEF